MGTVAGPGLCRRLGPGGVLRAVTRSWAHNHRTAGVILTDMIGSGQPECRPGRTPARARHMIIMAVTGPARRGPGPDGFYGPTDTAGSD